MRDAPVPGAEHAEQEPGDAEFEREFGEPLRRVLDLATWRSGPDLAELYDRLRLDVEVAEALRQQERAARAIRPKLQRLLRDPGRRNPPPLAGVWSVPVEQVEKVHRGTLFSGKVEACDGTVQFHDTLALTIVQVGVGLVGYRGDEGSWSYRLYRRDLRGGADDPFSEAMAILERRDRRAGLGQDGGGDRFAELGRRGIMSYAERAVLAYLSDAPWRMGHGSPAPFELLTGAGSLDLVMASLDVLRVLLCEHRRFVFVPSAPRQRALLTLGMALGPLEFAVVHRYRSYIEDVVERGNLRGKRREKARAFVEEVGPEVAVGVFRASGMAPPYAFYAPAEPELCAQAATIAIADAVLQEHRGFPLLLDMADQFCRAAFGHGEFHGPIQAAYAAHGHPLSHAPERETRG